MFETAATMRINALASRFASVDAAEIDRRSPAPAWEARGGRRAQWYAEEMEALVDNLPARDCGATRRGRPTGRTGGGVRAGSETMPRRARVHDYWPWSPSAARTIRWRAPSLRDPPVGGLRGARGVRQRTGHERERQRPGLDRRPQQRLYLVRLAVTGDGYDFTLDVKTATTRSALSIGTRPRPWPRRFATFMPGCRGARGAARDRDARHVRAGNGATHDGPA